MTKCDRPDCPGTVEETGFCDTCEMPPLSASPPSVPGNDSTSKSSGVGDPLSLPEFEFPDPSSRITSDPEVPEDSRRCGECGADVGRSYAGQPPISEGYCGNCGRPFSFRPSLRSDDVVGGQYRVLGCFARGGFGWIYLAQDTHLDDQFVVLKGLIGAGDQRRERQALIMMDHPNIVRIYNFVQHPDPRTVQQRDYIVMEYVDGLVLNEVREQAMAGGAPLGEPLRVEHVIACGVQILAAFEYLHGREWLYCDMTPRNVIIRSGRHGERASRIKLIDFGAMRRFGDRTSPIIGVPGYQVSDEEIYERGLTVQSDIHALGVTLARLFEATADHGDSFRGLIASGLESFRRVLDRATHRDADRRFTSAAEMAEQLRCVQREIASLRDGVARPEPSASFAPTATLLDAGLGRVPPLDGWINGVRILVDGRPAAKAVATGLPVPRVDPADPAADFLAAAGAPDAGRLLEKLSAAGFDSVELRLAQSRAQLELGDLAGADESLRRVDAGAGPDWRVRWHRGLLALARGQIAKAEAEFDSVYSALPGEDAPKLALGWCAEHAARLDRAERLYTAIWRRDRSQTSAAFGLARIRLAHGDRPGAVAVLDEVPERDGHYEAATIAGVIALSGQVRAGPPAPEDLRVAAARLPGLYLDDAARDRLTALVREAALDWVRASGQPLPVDGGAVLGTTPTERGLRALLARSYRALASQSPDLDTHGVLTDLANSTRPLTVL